MLSSWFFLALLSAVLWGIGYTMDEKLMNLGITPAFLALSHCLLFMPIYLYAATKYSNIFEEIRILKSDPLILLYFVIGGLAVLGGGFSILYSISLKNASYASIIEISYPFFVIIFSYLIFREVHINIYTLFGAILIFSGIAIVYLKN